LGGGGVEPPTPLGYASAHSRCGRYWRRESLPRSEPRTAQPVASRYTGWAIPVSHRTWCLQNIAIIRSNFVWCMSLYCRCGISLWWIATMETGGQYTALQQYLWYISKWYHTTCFRPYRKPLSNTLKYVNEECLRTTQLNTFNVFIWTFFKMCYIVWSCISIKAGTCRIVTLIMLQMCWIDCSILYCYLLYIYIYIHTHTHTHTHTHRVLCNQQMYLNIPENHRMFSLPFIHLRRNMEECLSS
jgi:hypothetical protein